MSSIPLVSVWMVTYNHQDYITQAIESVMMQKTNFPFHLFIGEDCSTDKTQILCNELKAKYPDKISLFLNIKNLGPNRNAENIYKACFNSGAKYIAMLEGDDYWTDPLKLQKQVDFLEQNKEYVMCYHNAKIIDENDRLVSESKLPINSQIDFEAIQLKTGAFILTLSVCFRNVIREFPPELYEVFNGDTFLFSILGQNGKGKFMREINDGIYRAHPNGMWSKINSDAKKENSLITNIKLKEYYKRLNDTDCVLIFEKRIKILRTSIILSKNKKLRNIILYSFAKKLKMMPIIWFFLYRMSNYFFNRGNLFKNKLRKSI